jgi:hypothetical protein
MSLRNLFLINMFVALIFSLALLLGPNILLEKFGMKTGPSENLMAQFFGAALVVPALLSWFAKDFNESGAQKSVTVSFFLFNAIGFVVALLGTLAEAMKSSGWTVVVIFLALAFGYGYFLFMKPSEM